jgi:hypothetical protein
MHEESESEEEDLPLTLPQVTHNESEKTAHYFVFSGDNKAGMHGYEKVRLTFCNSTFNLYLFIHQ